MKEFDINIFNAPTAEYRDAPFWSWNGTIEADELEKQIECFYDMGFGGFHIHPRTGMNTKYLSDEYMNLIKVCIDKAKELGMLVYLYDEDRWPSGFAGGFVTKNEKYRARHLLVTQTPYGEKQGSSSTAPFSVTSHRTGNGTLVAVYDVLLDENKMLKSFKKIDILTKAEGEKWYAYLELAECSPWFNGYTNADLLNKNATECFLKTTHDKFYKHFGELFGNVIPSVFTDEPQIAFQKMLDSPDSCNDVLLAWTDDLPDTCLEKHGTDLLENLPELIWESSSPSKVRYTYYKHLSERFMDGFLYPYSKWCEKHNLKFTGHFLEGTPQAQTNSVGDTMLMYDAQHIAGVDLLCSNTKVRFDAKLTQSVAQQNGRKRIMCEMYGVNNWDFSFKDYLFEGNWAAACGVNIRAPHLSMYTMEGEGKRDYPGSISYQAPWCEKYRVIEDYHARLNYILQLGTRKIRVGVINPIESMWLVYGNEAQTSRIRTQLDEQYMQITDWLTLGGIDFDFISESLLPKQFDCSSAQVGTMKYEVVIIPNCLTLRGTTVEIITAMQKKGVTIIFAGEIPKYTDAEPSQKIRKLAEHAKTIPFDQVSVLNAVEPYRIVEFHTTDGRPTDDLLHQIRQDGNDLYIYAASIVKPVGGNTRGRTITVKANGIYNAQTADLKNGTFTPIYAEHKNGSTYIACTIYDFGSLLLRLTKGEVQPIPAYESRPVERVKANLVSYSLSEPNVLILDQAQWQVDDGDIMPSEELLFMDNILRATWGLEERRDVISQPWTIEKKYLNHEVRLYFHFDGEFEYDGALLALEQIDDTTVCLNGESVQNTPVGYYADRQIKTIKLPKIQKGKNELCVKINYHTKTNVEYFYILGNFGIKLTGSEKTVTKLPEKIGFGDLTGQGFPFYGGNVTYTLKTDCTSPVTVSIPHYNGALVSIEQNGAEYDIIGAPYEVLLPKCSEKSREFNLTLYGTRYNTFGPLHNCDEKNFLNKSHPNAWRTKGSDKCDEYILKPFGIMASPQICKSLMKG